MKLRTMLFLFCCGVAYPIACSTGGDAFNNASAGGSDSAAGGRGTGSGSSSGGGSTVPAEAGVLPDSALVYEAAAPGSTIFGKLTADNCDPADPCCASFVWPMAEPLPNILMNTGAYVTQDGALYQYIGAETIIWPQLGCAPKNPTQYHCSEGRWWKDMGKTCPVT